MYANKVPELSSNVLTLVVISLPLSSIWAGSTLSRPISDSDSNSNRNLFDKLSFGSTLKHASNGSSPGAHTECFSGSAQMREQPGDVETGHGHGISVEHDISIHSYRERAV